jgi:alkylated DNA repair dioxygenase AlkB
VRECGDEPRLHALFTCTVSGSEYGRVQMEGNPLNTLPVISVVAKGLATKFKLKNSEWNIVCHLVLYQSGRDSIGWHADDTQGEDVVASLTTVDCPAQDARTICFQPASRPEDGDLPLELFSMNGDAYTMNELVQKHYVHAMMKTKEPNEENSNFQRMSIIFRNGISKTCKDNG